MYRNGDRSGQGDFQEKPGQGSCPWPIGPSWHGSRIKGIMAPTTKLGLSGRIIMRAIGMGRSAGTRAIIAYMATFSLPKPVCSVLSTSSKPMSHKELKLQHSFSYFFSSGDVN